MARVIGYVKSLEHGSFFVKDAQGNIRELKAGEAIHEGETVYGAKGNPSNAQIVIDVTLQGMGDLVIAGNGALNFDTSLLKGIFEDEDAVVYVNSVKDALALAGGDVTNVETDLRDGQTAGDNETAAGEVLNDQERASDTFNNRDGLIKDVRTDLNFTDSSRSTPTNDDQPFRPVVLEENVDAPAAQNDSVNTDEETPITIAVRGNDTDPDNDPLTVTAVTQGTNGSVSIDPVTGNPIYTPNTNFVGTDSFTYTISDGNGGTSTATVTVNVGNVNDAPVAQNDSVSATEDLPATYTVADIVNPNDTDLDGDTLTISAVSNPTNGTVVLNPDGTVTFTPTPNFNGVATFDYTITDGKGGFDTATVTVNVTPVDDPFTDANETVSVNEDTTLTGSVLTGTSSVDGAVTVTTFTVAGVTGTFNAGQTATITGVGTLTINANGSYTFVPVANYNGAVPVATYTMTDGSSTDTSTLTITVNPVNDAPTSTNDAITILEDLNNTTNVYTVSINDFGTYSDVDNNSLVSVRIDSLPTNGTLYLNGTAVSGGIEIPVASITGGLLTFDPTNHTDADSSFTFSVNDGTNWSSSSYTTTISITAVADVPNLTVATSSSSIIFSNSWETAANSDNTSEAVSGTTLEGWTLVTTPDPYAGGNNVFEIWADGDSQQRQDGNNNTVYSEVGNGTQFLELNNADANGALVQTLGISRSVATQAGMVYELSLDYAGRPGFDVNYTRIGVYLDGVLIQQYASTSPQTSIDWKALTFSFTGDGANHTLMIKTDASSYNSSGRGAFIDDIALTGYQGVTAGNAGSGVTSINLATYVTASLNDMDGSESLSLSFAGVPSGAKIVTANNTSGYLAVNGVITIDGSELSSAKLQFADTITGHLSMYVTATATELSNSETASVSKTLEIDVLAKSTSSDVVLDEVNGYSDVLGTTGDDTSSLNGTNANEILKGNTGNDRLGGTSGSGGNDILDGGVGNDTVRGGAGNDTIVFDAADTLLDGGTGTDTLMLMTGTNIDFSTLSNSVVKNIEIIDLSQNGNHQLTNLSLQDVIDMTDSNNDLYILGDSSDSVDFLNSNGWVKGGTPVTETVNGASHIFDVYTNTNDSTVIVKVEQAITDTI